MTKKIEATYGYLYNFAFVPRRKLLREFQQHKESIGKILTQMCGYLKVKVHWCLVADNHIQLLVELPKNLYRDNFFVSLQKLSTTIIKKRFHDLPSTLRYFWYAECWWRSYQPGTEKRNALEISEFVNRKLSKKAKVRRQVNCVESQGA